MKTYKALFIFLILLNACQSKNTVSAAVGQPFSPL